MNSCYKLKNLNYCRKVAKRSGRERHFDDNQVGFKKGRETEKNIYVLRHIIDQEEKRKRGRYMHYSQI